MSTEIWTLIGVLIVQTGGIIATVIRSSGGLRDRVGKLESTAVLGADCGRRHGELTNRVTRLEAQHQSCKVCK